MGCLYHNVKAMHPTPIKDAIPTSIFPTPLLAVVLALGAAVVAPLPLGLTALSLELALGLEELDAPSNATLSDETSKPVVDGARVIPVPFIQTPFVPGAPSVKFTPAH
jgi:hypothetical protein